MSAKKLTKKNMSKPLKIARIKELIQEVYEVEPQDLTRIYDMDDDCLEGPWDDLILDALYYHPKGKSPLVPKVKYLPSTWLTRAEVFENPIRVWKGDFKKFEQEDVQVLPARVVIQAVRRMVRELGREPEKRFIISTPKGYFSAKLRPTTHDELNACLDTLEKAKADQDNKEEREQQERRKQSLQSLVERVGLDRAVELLEDEVEALKDGERESPRLNWGEEDPTQWENDLPREGS